MIELKADNKRLLDALNGLLKRGQDPKPALQDMGEYLVETTKRRFATKTGPDGIKWKDNADQTVARKGSNDPLIGESRRLANEIHYRADSNSITWGSSLAYAAMQQLGGLKEAYPHLWGDIPARRFLGISDEDEKQLPEILQEYLTAPLEGGSA